MYVVCLDFEGVLVPEIWVELASHSGIDALAQTTRDVPDYDVLMAQRLAILKRNGLGMAAIREVVSGMRPLPGAETFLAALRRRCQVLILSDTYYEFAQPLAEMLAWPTLFCHRLEVDGDVIAEYHLRLADHKKKTVQALRELNFPVIAAGDSYNDIGMLSEADRAALYAPPDNVAREYPQFPVARSHPELLTLIDDAANDLQAGS